MRAHGFADMPDWPQTQQKQPLSLENGCFLCFLGIFQFSRKIGITSAGVLRQLQILHRLPRSLSLCCIMEASHIIRAAGKDTLSFFVIAGQQRHNIRIVSAENDPECSAKAVRSKAQLGLCFEFAHIFAQEQGRTPRLIRREIQHDAPDQTGDPARRTSCPALCAVRP